MGILHITEAELARDLHAVLAKVRQGVEVVVGETATSPLTISLRPAIPFARPLSDVLARLPRQSTAIPDDDFAADLQSVIDSHREPLDPPAWD